MKWIDTGILHREGIKDVYFTAFIGDRYCIEITLIKVVYKEGDRTHLDEWWELDINNTKLTKFRATSSDEAKKNSLSILLEFFISASDKIIKSKYET